MKTKKEKCIELVKLSGWDNMQECSLYDLPVPLKEKIFEISVNIFYNDLSEEAVDFLTNMYKNKIYQEEIVVKLPLLMEKALQAGNQAAEEFAEHNPVPNGFFN